MSVHNRLLCVKVSYKATVKASASTAVWPEGLELIQWQDSVPQDLLQ